MMAITGAGTVIQMATNFTIHIYKITLTGKGNENHQLGTGFFVHQRIASAVKVEFVSDSLSYIVLRGR
jgi:hypothetical protein